MGIGRVGIGERTERLMRHNELTTVRAPGEPADVVGRKILDQSEPPDRNIDHGQLPAESVGHDQIHTIGTDNLEPRRKGKRNHSGRLQMQRSTGTPLEVHHRHLVRPERSDETSLTRAIAADTHRKRADRKRLGDRQLTSALANEMELMCGPIGHEKLAFRFPRHGDQIGETLADRHFGRDTMGYQVDERNGAAAFVGDQEERSLIRQSHGDGIPQAGDRLRGCPTGTFRSRQPSAAASAREDTRKINSTSGRSG